MGVSVKAMKREESSLKGISRIISCYSKEPKTLLGKIQWFNADFQDRDSLLKMLDGVSKVYHCAGFVSFKPKDKDRIYHANLYGTKNILNEVVEAKVNIFCHLSSSSATDKNFMHSYVTEEMVWRSKQISLAMPEF